LLLGNLAPGKEAVINLQLIKTLKKTTGSSYDLTIPLYYLPQYRKHEVFEYRADYSFFDAQMGQDIFPEYSFEYNFDIKSSKKIILVSGPQGCVSKTSDTQFKVSAPASKVIPKRELRIFYKTEVMHEPELKFQRRGDEVACMYSVIPTFEHFSNPQEQITNDEPLGQELSHGKDFFFQFVVDCSGSMSGSRMNTAKEALKLFIQSLPESSTFSIILFGNKHNYFKNAKSWNYNDETMEKVLNEINNIRADLGGTNIIKPLKEAVNNKAAGLRFKRVFLLTDGEVDSHERKEIIQFAEASADKCRIHTFGIGRECDK